jgi:DNA-directed RNA polymerase subunit M/transcription elongation factor TFIIS
VSRLFDEKTRFTPLPTDQKAREDEHVISQAHFSCENCGSHLVYSPTSQDLLCRNCGHHYPVDTSHEQIHEYDFKEAVQELARLRREAPKTSEIAIIQCPSCGAEFSFNDNEHAGDCPYCATPVIAGTAHARFIVPRSLLPFLIEQKQAIEIYDKWIGSRWFAPSALKNHSKRDDKLVGIFLPYWTYDSQTSNNYRGQRGITYYDRQVYSTVVNGRRVQRVRTVARIRWTPVAGRVNLHFDDVLIGATKTLPRTIINHLQPWDLDNLVPYSEEYISGFRSEIYQVTVDQGFLQAENIMETKIHQSVRYDIGGDHQRISAVNTQHQDTTFKHVLLPVWSAAFKYRNKTYRYVINGRNGTIQGERPYSFIKIGLAVLAGAIAVFGLLFAMDQQGAFNQSSYNSGHTRVNQDRYNQNNRRFNNEFFENSFRLDRYQNPRTPKSNTQPTDFDSFIRFDSF